MRQRFVTASSLLGLAAWVGLTACGAFSLDPLPGSGLAEPDAGRADERDDAAPERDATSSPEDARTADAGEPVRETEAGGPDAAGCTLLPHDFDLLQPGALQTAGWFVADGFVQTPAGLVRAGGTLSPSDLVARCDAAAHPYALSSGIRFEYEVLVDIKPTGLDRATLLALGSGGPGPIVSLTIEPSGYVYLRAGSDSRFAGDLDDDDVVVGAVLRRGSETRVCAAITNREDAATKCVDAGDLSRVGFETQSPVDVGTVSFGLAGATVNTRTTSKRFLLSTLPPEP